MLKYIHNPKDNNSIVVKAIILLKEIEPIIITEGEHTMLTTHDKVDMVHPAVMCEYLNDIYMEQPLYPLDPDQKNLVRTSYWLLIEIYKSNAVLERKEVIQMILDNVADFRMHELCMTDMFLIPLILKHRDDFKLDKIIKQFRGKEWIFAQ